MNSKWFATSKIVLASTGIILTNLLPMVPPTWAPWISIALALAAALDRVSGSKPALTLLPDLTGQSTLK